MVNETRAEEGTDQLSATQTPEAPALWRRLLDLGQGLGSEWRVIRGAGLELDPPSEAAAAGEAELVETDAFELHDVGEPADSRFRFFLDGIERARVGGYLGLIPIVHGYVAAVIRERSDRSFTTWGAEEREVVAFPHEHLDPQRLLDLGFPEEALLDSGGDDAPLHPVRLAERGRKAIQRARERLEARLARRWVKAGADGWLMLDGRLAIEPSVADCGRAIGVVKTHRTQFLPPDAMRLVLSGQVGHRSPVFRPTRPEIGAVYSWYLRLRSSEGRDIYWALARIEGRAGPETIERADEVSRWLLHEIRPIAMPDPRWHVLLYPIRDCESYLRARMPTLGTS